jgi:pilus assembly protein CpaC
MLRLNRFNIVKLMVFTILLMVFPVTSWATDSSGLNAQKPERLQLVVGKSIILKSDRPAKRVSIADPAIADFVLISPYEIYVTGKSSGVTNLTLWQNKKIFAIYDLEVSYDVSRLKQRLHEALPGERDLRVIATHDSITLAGKISNTANLSQAMALARTYAPEGKVTNLIEVGGVHQVMLEVRVAEMARSLVRRFGVNFNYVKGGQFGVSTLGGLSEVVNPLDANIVTQDASGVGSPVQFLVSPAVNALFRFKSNGANWTGFIDALKQDGLAKILAEPTLVSLSGQTANFLAGGEFPIPVPQGLGTVAIEYKPFGVGLSFTPTVLSENKIAIKVEPEVSELDFSTAVQFQGFVVPGLSTRKASTMVELADGQSFAIAGLLRENIRDVLNKFPLLGDIPVLGALFRSRGFQKNETELIIIATPHLVKPLNMEKQTLPTDYYKEPDDTEFYILGFMEGSEGSSPATTKGTLDGDFGHTMPKSN